MKHGFGVALLVIVVSLLIFIGCANIANADGTDSNKNEFTKKGNIVTFGCYEQDNNVSNGKEPIEWIVLDTGKKKSLLISRFALNCYPYHAQWTEITWEKCAIRNWLNSTFMNDAFTSDQQAAIITVKTDNGKNQRNSNWNTKGGNDTEDQMFLLSCAEAEKYFKNNDDRLLTSTPYAKAQGADTGLDDNIIWWWLRSPGYVQFFAANIDIDGTIYSAEVNANYLAVRPAFWIDLKFKMLQ